MNNHNIEEIREYLMNKLNTLRNGSYPYEVKILEKLLVITTERLDNHNGNTPKPILPQDEFTNSHCDNSESSSSASNNNQQVSKDKEKEELAELTTSPSDNERMMDGVVTSHIADCQPVDVCSCGHHTNDHSYDPSLSLDMRLHCDKCDCTNFKSKGCANEIKIRDDDNWLCGHEGHLCEECSQSKSKAKSEDKK